MSSATSVWVSAESLMQHTATHCNTLQHTATCCNVTCINETQSHSCNTLQHTAVSHVPSARHFVCIATWCVCVYHRHLVAHVYQFHVPCRHAIPQTASSAKIFIKEWMSKEAFMYIFICIHRYICTYINVCIYMYVCVRVWHARVIYMRHPKRMLACNTGMLPAFMQHTATHCNTLQHTAMLHVWMRGRLSPSATKYE